MYIHIPIIQTVQTVEIRGGVDGNFYWFFVFSLIMCRCHSRTLPPTLDSREMFASVTAALRTPPCLFPYAGARTDYTVKYAIKYTAAVKQLPASFAPISPFAVGLLQLFIYRAVDRSSIDKHRAPPALTCSTALSEAITL